MIVGGYCYHVINRGNNRAVRFHSRSDYDEFLRLMLEANERVRVPLLSACLMPNHVHLVMRPLNDSDLARWIHWLFLKYSRLYHARHGTTGRVWENRYKAFPIQGDSHLLIVMRYVERNAPSAPCVVDESPVALPADWNQLVNAPQTGDELQALRNCVNRQSPFGEAEWVKQTAALLGLEHAIAPIGRP